MSRSLVIDASALVDLLLGEPASERIADRIERSSLHAPAHIELELLSAFGRIGRSGQLTSAEVDLRLRAAESVPIHRHALDGLSAGAWRRRQSLRISDAFYVELADQLAVPLITTDLRLARATPRAEAI
ncbi:MAG TPA: type II toxin-antitoxin system VapC family toxin [Propionibacteriaceae bacterium]|nr:type II toxin-antitoxin system VapC family toxin [Propionibacteriaceae bacterium]